MLGFLRRWFARRDGVAKVLAARPTRAIVGLGNPGEQYAATRHNVGFRCLERLADGVSWSEPLAEFKSRVALLAVDDQLLLLVEPHTFMNRSGEAVERILAHYRLAPAQCLIVYDEMDLPLGTLRLRERGSAGTHNGMRSVVASLHTDQVPRLRLGIGQAVPGAAHDHVLGTFATSEQPAVEALLARAAAAAKDWAILGAANAMNRYNKG
jgi:PTH1 family peptidyl-tRNA hydrolase